MPNYFTTAMDDAPTVYYRLGESSGTNATDSSGNGNTGTYAASGVTYSVSGAIKADTNTAVTFNGSSGKCTTPSGVNPSTFSLECWVKIASNPSSGASVFANWTGGTTHGMGLGMNTSGQVQFGVYNTSGTIADIFSSALSTGVWHHVVGTYASGGTLTLYIDGSSVGTNTQAAPSTATIAYQIGSSGFNDFFPGSVDEACIYSAVLSSTRVSAHYNAGIATRAYKPVSDGTGGVFS